MRYPHLYLGLLTLLVLTAPFESSAKSSSDLQEAIFYVH
jgi:hypothetical protein